MANKLKKPAHWGSSFFVITYMIIYMLMTFAQCAVTVITKFTNFTAFNVNFSVPLDIWGWGLLIVISAYVGTDRLSSTIKTAHMEVGAADMGDPAKLRQIIYWTAAIVAQNYILSFFFDVNLPLEAVTSTFISSVGLYTAGNKVIQTTQSINIAGDDTYISDSEVIIDTNGDGIDDREQNLDNSK